MRKYSFLIKPCSLILASVFLTYFGYFFLQHTLEMLQGPAKEGSFQVVAILIAFNYLWAGTLISCITAIFSKTEEKAFIPFILSIMAVFVFMIVVVFNLFRNNHSLENLQIASVIIGIICSLGGIGVIFFADFEAKVTVSKNIAEQETN